MGTRRYTIKQLPPELRPRERLLSEGPEALSSAELLGILFGTGSKETTAVELAGQVISQSWRELNAWHRLAFDAILGVHVAPLVRDEAALVKIYRFQEATAASGHARKRFLSDMHRHTSFLAQPLVQIPEECSATCEDHPPIHDV